MPIASLTRAVQIPDGYVQLDGDLLLPPSSLRGGDDAGTPASAGLIIFAHGSGSSRKSSRNREVAEILAAGGFATLLLDLLSAQEEYVDQLTGQFRFDVPRLARRVVAAVDWASEEESLQSLAVGCFGASTGAAAALIAAAERPDRTAAVVSRGGRPDLAGEVLPRVLAPTLLIVGGADEPVIELNENAMRRMSATVRLEIVPGATHLFEEPGALGRVGHLAAEWFTSHLSRHR